MRLLTARLSRAGAYLRRNRWARLAVLVPAAAALAVALWQGLDWDVVFGAFRSVDFEGPLVT